MTTYAIGDIQGCFIPFQKLLEKIHFDPQKDTLWLTGDLINRGPQSLETLRFIKKIKHAVHVVLGNHDLHVLACAHGAHPGWEEDTVSDILQAPDREELLDWLQHQPLLYHDPAFQMTMVHAGVAASWDLEKAKKLAHEVESVLQSDQASEFFHHMYGNLPDQWNDDLQGFDRLRCITNFFTRARFCHSDGRLELSSKGKLNSSALTPWFNVPHRATQNDKILFGHWAALGGETHTPNAIALDTGCVWGFCLTAMRLEDGVRFSVEC